MMPERDLLMIPGPTMVDPAVLRAMSAPVISMSAPEFIEIFGATLEGVRTVLGGQTGQAYVFAGSGHLALEFGVGLLPASIVGARFAGRFSKGAQRRAFGWFLVVFGGAFVLYRLIVA